MCDAKVVCCWLEGKCSMKSISKMNAQCSGIYDLKFFLFLYKELEIKSCWLGSRIRNIEAEWRLKVIIDLISWMFGKQNWRCGMNRILSVSKDDVFCV